MTSGLLDDYLCRVYPARHMGVGDLDVIERSLAAACRHPEMRRTAQQRLAELRKLDDRRCHMSKLMRETLERALGG